MAQITTWDDFESVHGALLVVLNSQTVGDPIAGVVWEELNRRTSLENIRVVADRAWSAWIEERRVPLPLVKFAEDRAGAPLEINYFLEQPDTLRWAEQSGIRLIAGTSPHNLYNEEVQSVFERRAAFLVANRGGRLLAHTLPHRYLYLFDLTDLLDRMGRELKIVAYENSVRALVDDLHRWWETHGRPQTADRTTDDDVLRVVAAHLGESILKYDEKSRIPIWSPSPSFGIGDFVAEVHAAYLRLAEDYAGLLEADAIKDAAIEAARRLTTPGE